MEFKIHSDSESNSSVHRSRTPNYSATSVRLRMASLVAALGLVVLAMNEAGKPQNWQWLGFHSSDNQVEQLNDTRRSDSTQETSNNRSMTEETANLEINPVFQNYWYELFDELTTNQKKLLVNKFWEPAIHSPDDKQISTFSKNFLKIYLERNPILSESNIDDLRSGNKLWQDFLARDHEPESNKFHVIRKIYEDSIYDVVEDRSAMNRSVESAAWNWSWKKLTDDQTNYPGVTYIQIAGQPATHRGQKIRISGSARGLQKIDLPDEHELGFDSYKVLWVKPQDSNHVPYCVYLKELPPGFPTATNAFVELNEQVSVDGVFFKLRSYIAKNDQIEICPLIVAESLNWTPTNAVVSAPSWQPPAWLLTLFFIAMPIVAGLMAWSVYRATTADSPVSRIGVSDDHNNTWDNLSKRSDIKSDFERINELYPSE